MASAEDDPASDTDESMVDSIGQKELFDMTNAANVNELTKNGIVNSSRTTIWRFGPLTMNRNASNFVRKLETSPASSSLQRLRPSPSKHPDSLKRWMVKPPVSDPWRSHQVPPSRLMSERKEKALSLPHHSGSHIALSNGVKAFTHMGDGVKSFEQPHFPFSAFGTIPGYALVDIDRFNDCQDKAIDEVPGFVVEKPLEHQFFESKVACTHSPSATPSAKPFPSNQQTPVLQMLPRGSSSHHSAFPGSYERKANGSTARKLGSQSTLNNGEQIQESTRRPGNGRKKLSTSPKTHAVKKRRLRCWEYFNPSVRCQTREKHVSQLIRHYRSHGIFFCGKDAQFFDTREDWELHNRGNHYDQMCVNFECDSSLPHCHPKTEVCKAWHDLTNEEKWMSVFAVTLMPMGLMFPDWHNVCVVEESRYSPADSELSFSGSDVSPMAIEPPQSDIDASLNGRNMEIDQPDGWLTLTPGDTYERAPRNTNNLPLPMQNNANTNGIQLDGPLQQTIRLQENNNRLTQENATWRDNCQHLLRVHLEMQQLLRTHPAQLPQSDQPFAWLANHQEFLLGFPLQDNVQIPVNGNNVQLENAGPDVAGGNITQPDTHNPGFVNLQPDPYLGFPEQENPFGYDASDNFRQN